MYKTEWTHKAPELTEAQLTHMTQEIAHISDELDRASDLIFHTIFLTPDMKGAIVIVDGQPGVEDTLYLTYYEQPKWASEKIEEYDV